ncbi:hypothetical protein ANCCEY_13635 [Ancylostoma ceylanicum]|uniref:Uncharacterized protein n=2 Tax=Ancylostoma ceylanicum TaxID=53326 RepID=A0A8I3B221_9BILA|nr:hypothetical protein ANCCEY_13635 [Ancylostoma ceylanicum]EYC28691.1 hypothetical protein Y032_0007g3360 [Ancylostoma ceylanicum]
MGSASAIFREENNVHIYDDVAKTVIKTAPSNHHNDDHANPNDDKIDNIEQSPNDTYNGTVHNNDYPANNNRDHKYNDDFFFDDNISDPTNFTNHSSDDDD